MSPSQNFPPGFPALCKKGGIDNFTEKYIEPHPSKTLVGWTLIGAFGSYLIFEVWMKLRLPKGFLGI